MRVENGQNKNNILFPFFLAPFESLPFFWVIINNLKVAFHSQSDFIFVEGATGEKRIKKKEIDFLIISKNIRKKHFFSSRQTQRKSIVEIIAEIIV